MEALKRYFHTPQEPSLHERFRKLTTSTVGNINEGVYKKQQTHLRPHSTLSHLTKVFTKQDLPIEQALPVPIPPPCTPALLKLPLRRRELKQQKYDSDQRMA